MIPSSYLYLIAVKLSEYGISFPIRRLLMQQIIIVPCEDAATLVHSALTLMTSSAIMAGAGSYWCIQETNRDNFVYIRFNLYYVVFIEQL